MLFHALNLSGVMRLTAKKTIPKSKVSITVAGVLTEAESCTVAGLRLFLLTSIGQQWSFMS